ncbi:MAG: hypothetical protein J6A74_04185 [Oscillospiraceae bacterium]|nr:hypothetical protein [Oscillospiraceae bacterium]
MDYDREKGAFAGRGRRSPEPDHLYHLSYAQVLQQNRMLRRSVDLTGDLLPKPLHNTQEE